MNSCGDKEVIVNIFADNFSSPIGTKLLQTWFALSGITSMEIKDHEQLEASAIISDLNG